MPFLARRKDVGKYAYWRILDRAVAPFVRGEIHRSWAVASHALSGKAIVKLSLPATMRSPATDGPKWALTHF